MAKPLHFMRLAPADYVQDPIVQLALMRRDFLASAFYPLFLFHSAIQGGTLPDSPELLSATLRMRPRDIQKALAFWTKHNKIQRRNGALFNPRVVRDIAATKAFRQAEAKRIRNVRSRVRRTESVRTPPVRRPIPLSVSVSVSNSKVRHTRAGARLGLIRSALTNRNGAGSALWSRALAWLEAHLKETGVHAHAFATWFRPSEGLGLVKGRPGKAAVLVVGVPSAQFRDWLASNYGAVVTKALVMSSSKGERPPAVEFVTNAEQAAAKAAQEG